MRKRGLKCYQRVTSWEWTDVFSFGVSLFYGSTNIPWPSCETEQDVKVSIIFIVKSLWSPLFNSFRELLCCILHFFIFSSSQDETLVGRPVWQVERILTLANSQKFWDQKKLLGKTGMRPMGAYTSDRVRLDKDFSNTFCVFQEKCIWFVMELSFSRLKQFKFFLRNRSSFLLRLYAKRPKTPSGFSPLLGRKKIERSLQTIEIKRVIDKKKWREIFLTTWAFSGRSFFLLESILKLFWASLPKSKTNLCGICFPFYHWWRRRTSDQNRNPTFPAVSEIHNCESLLNPEKENSVACLLSSERAFREI